jgi:hypothetical protein
MRLDQKLKKLWAKMAALTRPRCSQDCKLPFSCCSVEYCLFAISYAKSSWGEELTTTRHPRLPLMGPDGCVAPPHTRPLCTVHVCEDTLMSLELEDRKWTKKYWSLRQKIDGLELKRAER